MNSTKAALPEHIYPALEALDVADVEALRTTTRPSDQELHPCSIV